MLHVFILIIGKYMIVVCMFQLENQYSLFDYSININDCIQLTVVPVTEETITDTIEESTFKLSENLKKKTTIPSCVSDTNKKTEKVNYLL